MREIKFRGKKENGEWLYGSLIDCLCFRSILSIAITRDTPIDMLGCEIIRGKVKDKTIGQYTGLPDMVGNEIYENDIVDAPYVDSFFRDVHPTARAKAVIKFINGTFVVEYSEDCRIYLQDLHERIVVVGNIYDNKSLLEDRE